MAGKETDSECNKTKQCTKILNKAAQVEVFSHWFPNFDATILKVAKHFRQLFFV